MKKEVLFSGKGGQGLGVMGRILALAATIEEKEVASSSSYGGEVTGGLSQSEVIISDEAIDFPSVLDPDILVTVSQDSYDQLISHTDCRALLFCDPGLIDPDHNREGPGLILIPAAEQAVENFGKSQFANMIMLGAVVALTQIARPESVAQVIGQEFKAKSPELNQRAFAIGLRIGGEASQCPVGDLANREH